MKLREHLYAEHLEKVAKEIPEEKSREALEHPFRHSLRHQLPASTALGAGIGAVAGGLLSRGKANAFASPENRRLLGLGVGMGSGVGALVGTGNALMERDLRAKATGHLLLGKDPGNIMMKNNMKDGAIVGGATGMLIGSNLPGIAPMALGTLGGAALVGGPVGLASKLVGDSQKRHFNNLLGEDGKYDEEKHGRPLKPVARFNLADLL